MYRWAREFSNEKAPDGRPSNEHLASENRRLRREVEFLKKASRYFASQQSTHARLFAAAIRRTRCGKRRVRRLMRTAGLKGIPKKRHRQRRPRRTDRNIPDLLHRDFSATHPNLVLGTDITEFATGDGKFYLFVIKDVYDGTLATWKTSTRTTAEWVTSTVKLALAKQPVTNGTILHLNNLPFSKAFFKFFAFFKYFSLCCFVEGSAPIPPKYENFHETTVWL